MDHSFRGRSDAARGRRRNRTGSTWWLVLGALVGVTVIGGVTVYFVMGASENVADKPIVVPVVNAPFDHTVLEEGEIESSNSVEVKCQVKSRNSGGTEIIWVVDEGTHVEAGDLLCKLDASLLQQELDQQRINCNTSQALVVQAENAFRAAEIALKEYEQGTYAQERQLILNEIFVANENLERTRQSIASTERLAAKGLTDMLQLQADQFAVEKAQNELKSARGKLTVLDMYTSQKMIKTFESDIATAEAKWGAEKQSHSLELKKLAELEEQVKACTITAPVAGQVVHANRYSSRGGAEFVVEQGARVTEGKAIIRIPDPSQMQVRAKINESQVTLVKPNMPVSIRIDAIPDSNLRGEVTRVNKYAEPGNWASGQIKEYMTLVRILDPPDVIRSGMTAEVRIHVEQRPAALQVQTQAVCEHKGQYFCLVETGKNKYETRPITIGSSNQKMVTIESGNVQEGEQLVMNPRGFEQLLNLPDLPDPQRMQVASESSSADGVPSDGRPGPPSGGPPGSDQAGDGSPGGGPPGGGPPGGGAPGGGRVSPMDRFDSDGDGRLSSDELAAAPEQLRGRLSSADADGDGFIDGGELTQAFAALRQAGGFGGGPPPSGGGEGE
ncbi:MAG: efflux RND transporter periplasmic adaptor subunit [Pirellulaceae bacterium]